MLSITLPSKYSLPVIDRLFTSSEKSMLTSVQRRSFLPRVLPNFSLRLFSWASLVYVIFESVAAPVVAQQVLSGLSSLSITPSLPAISGGEERFQIDSNLICPTATVGLGVYGGRGNNFAYADEPYADSSSNLSNYGIAAGIRLPLNNYLTEFCKDYAKKRVEFESIRTENFRRNTLLTLIEQCRWAKEQGVQQENTGQMQGDNLGLGKFFSFCSNVKFVTNNTNQEREIRLPLEKSGGKDRQNNRKVSSAPQRIRQSSLIPPDSPITNPSPPTPLWNGSTPAEAVNKQDSEGPPQSDTRSFSQPNPVLQFQGR
jgi:hypothetical protein